MTEIQSDERGDRCPDMALATEPDAPRAGIGLIGRVLEAQQRERDHVVAEIVKVKGLMPLLMKQRNGEDWCAADRRELLERLRSLSQLSPYLVAVALPGSILLLPFLAWWLDRRRGANRGRRID